MSMFEMEVEEVPDVELLPSYSDRGRILFEIYHIYADPEESLARYELEVSDYDADSSIMWLAEGISIEYFLLDVLGLDLEDTGWYVVENVHGVYHKGSMFDMDDDESWYSGIIRRATPEEIASGALCPRKSQG